MQAMELMLLGSVFKRSVKATAPYLSFPLNPSELAGSHCEITERPSIKGPTEQQYEQGGRSVTRSRKLHRENLGSLRWAILIVKSAIHSLEMNEGVNKRFATAGD